MIRARAHAGQFIGALAYAPGGGSVAVGGLDGTVTLRDAGGLGRLCSFRAQPTLVSGLAFSPRAGALATGGDASEAVRVWDADTGRLLATLPGHAGGVPTLAFSPDGSLLAAATGAGRVYLWDSGSWGVVGVLEGPRAWLSALAFSPDGRSLATAGDDRTLRIWECPRPSPPAPEELTTHRPAHSRPDPGAVGCLLDVPAALARRDAERGKTNDRSNRTEGCDAVADRIGDRSDRECCRRGGGSLAGHRSGRGATVAGAGEEGERGAGVRRQPPGAAGPESDRGGRRR
ncbi:WD40 repeat domain-containing protein [Singulisphaera sp. PoT]|uniref:WD40 repeat domain-containing protein n=1 Tax=Singulisphaera sp. PoT TaxID=3411797 RepID=UPI003BF4D997